tara:strand:+ start:1628 stop:2101 length:474 start_codon:yes stop_codon:yes gene_type:complete
MRPDLVHYDSPVEYKEHYIREYCRNEVVTADGIRIYFKQNKFEHAFYESSNRDGRKDQFSEYRSQRIDWIKATLESSKARLKAGWNKKKRCAEHTSRVAVLLDDFVVIIRMSFRGGKLRGEFVTAYVANNSMEKIESGPNWDRAECIKTLTKGKLGR